MFIDDISILTGKDKVQVQCDECSSVFVRPLKQMKAARKRRGVDLDYCLTCSRKKGAEKRPQNSKEFWDVNKQSDAYYEGIKNRPSIKGKNNPMWGRSFSEASRQKRSQIWTQFTGENQGIGKEGS